MENNKGNLGWGSLGFIIGYTMAEVRFNYFWHLTYLLLIIGTGVLGYQFGAGEIQLWKGMFGG